MGILHHEKTATKKTQQKKSKMTFSFAGNAAAAGNDALASRAPSSSTSSEHQLPQRNAPGGAYPSLKQHGSLVSLRGK